MTVAAGLVIVQHRTRPLQTYPTISPSRVPSCNESATLRNISTTSCSYRQLTMLSDVLPVVQ